MSLLTSPFVVGLGAFYLLTALPGPFLARLGLCAGLVIGCMAWRRRDSATSVVDETIWADDDGWLEDDPAMVGASAVSEPGWTVTRPRAGRRAAPPAPPPAAAALAEGTRELQLVAVLTNQAGQRAEVHLAPGMATLPVAMLARQAAGLLAAEQGDTGWRLVALELLHPTHASHKAAPAPWGWGG